MEKVTQLQETKGTQVSFPIIINSVKQRDNQSDKSLFKNDSLSSDEVAPYPPPPMKVPINNNLLDVDQIKKFLKKGDQLNYETIKKLKEDKVIHQITKNDRSSASLYKNSRYLDYASLQNPKAKEIKRIYKSTKKTNSRPSLLMPFRRKKTSQQVQTDQFLPTYILDSRRDLLYQNPYRYPSLYNQMSYNTIEAIEQQSTNKDKDKNNTTITIQEDAQENALLPQKQKKNLSGRAKAISSRPQINQYLNTIGKTEFNFYTGMGRINNRYRQYKEQETIFSKTIDVKPVVPLKQYLNNGDLTKEQNNKPVEIQHTQKIKTNLNLSTELQAFKPDSKQLNLEKINQLKKQSNSQYQSMAQHKQKQTSKSISRQKPLLLPKNQLSFDKQSSMIAEESQNVSPDATSRSIEMISRITENIIQFFPNSPSQKHKRDKIHKNKNVIDNQKHNIQVQVPSVHQLKIGDMNSEEKIQHPIRQSFNHSDMEWIKNKYSPKHQLLKDIGLSDFSIKKYKNGVYFGQLDQEGKKHGKGIIFYFSGKIYEGQINKDMKSGKGLQIYPDGSRYKGDFISGIKQGRGIFEWSNGEVYDGQWQNGKKNGSGMWKGSDGQSYIGQWKNGKVQGFGVYAMKNGSRYEGQFKNSLKHGVGTERFINGETFVGSYDKNRPNGQGEYYWANGDYYKGQFSNGLRHGQGYFKQGKTQIQYRGQYKNDKKCGYGQINYGNDLTYVGNFENNFRHGFGQLLQKGQTKYKGYWINDNRVDQQQQNTSNTNTKTNTNTFIKFNQNSNISTNISSNNVNQPQKINIPKKKQNRITGITSIKQDELQRQESLPKILPKVQKQMINSHYHSHSPSMNSISPEGEGYKRPCGCNKKH